MRTRTPARSLALCTVGGFLLFASCTLKEENPVGFDLGRGLGWDPVTFHPIYPDGWDGHRTTARGGGTTVMWVGASHGYTARGLVKFELLDTTTTVVAVYEANLQLSRPVATDSSGGVVGLYQIISPWTETTVGWEMAEGDSVAWDTPGGDYDSLSPIALDTLEASSEDTALCFALDPAMIESALLGEIWQDGFLVRLVDEAESTFLRFATKEGALAPEITYSLGILEDDSTIVDTVTVSASEDAYIVEHFYELPEGALPIGSGVGYRSLLRFPLPEEVDSTWTVNRARLVIHPDTTTFYTTGSLTRVQAYRVSGDWDGADTPLDSWVFGTVTLGPQTVEDSLEVTLLVQGWIKGAWENMGLALRAENLVYNVSLVLLHTPAEPDTSLWPYLEITCTPPAFAPTVAPVRVECSRD